MKCTVKGNKKLRSHNYIIVTDIALHTSNYCVYCIEDQDSDTHKIIAQKYFKKSRNLFGTAILGIN